MKKKNAQTIYAFIDSQNLNLGIRSCGWKLDFEQFRIYLRDKYKVEKAFLFIGYFPGNESLYTYLQKAGYIVIFKPTLEIKKDGKTIIKGNVDAELVLHAMIEYTNYEKAIIVSGDGDFHCIIEYLIDQKKLQHMLAPCRGGMSSLLKKFGRYVRFVSDAKQRLENKK